jgi:hypothetical protein
MARRRYWPDLPPVADLPVAPHRYLWTAPYTPEPETYRQAVDSAPYKVGDVVYVIEGGGEFRRAYITFVGASRNYYGDLREEYTVRPETKAGAWARREYKVFPGFIQRGYKRAGLAPEMPADERIMG